MVVSVTAGARAARRVSVCVVGVGVRGCAEGLAGPVSGPVVAKRGRPTDGVHGLRRLVVGVHGPGDGERGRARLHI